MAQLKGETPQPPAKQLQQRFARYGDVVVDRRSIDPNVRAPTYGGVRARSHG
jgi:hypothetical protein